jgi:hypothetical protein
MTPEERQQVRERLRAVPPPSGTPGTGQGFQSGPSPSPAPPRRLPPPGSPPGGPPPPPSSR